VTRGLSVFALPIVKVVGNVYPGGGPSNCGTLAEYGGGASIAKTQVSGLRRGILIGSF